MKPYSIFRITARVIALLAMTIGLSGTIYAQEDKSAPDTSESQAKSAGTAKQLPCGGPSVIICPAGLSCVDDSSDKCDPTKDGLTCPGKCVAGSGEQSKIKQPCGGPTRIACIGGMVCVDDPSDKCDPTKDGFDCKGMCVTRP